MAYEILRLKATVEMVSKCNLEDSASDLTNL